MVKKSLIWTYRAALTAMWLSIIALAIAILSLRYFVLPNIEHYKDQIAETISQTAGRKITIGNISASWSGMNPHLSLRQVAIYDTEDRMALTLYEVETSLSWLSLVSLEPKLASLIIQGPALSVRRETDGTLVVAGIRMGGESEPELANWILRQSRIDIVDATILWQDDLRQAPALTLNELQLSIESPVLERLIKRHRFALKATPSAGSSHPVELRGNLYGNDVGNLQGWRGTIYGRMDGTDIAAWRQWIDYPFELNQGYGAARFWLEFSDGMADRLTSDVILQKVRARLAKNRAEAKLDTLSARLIWSRQTDGQSFNLQRVKLTSAGGLEVENGAFGIRTRLQNGKESIDGSVKLDQINLAAINTFIAHLPLPETAAEHLNHLEPVGTVSNLDLRWKGDRDQFNEYNIGMQFSDLGIQPYKEIPGFSNLSGKLNADEKQGTITINSQQAAVDIKGVMRWPIPADKLTGIVKWSNHDKGTDVRVNNLTISSPHLAGVVNATYKHGTTAPSSIELNGRFERGDAKYALFYYPVMLGKDTLDWLDSSIISGKVSDIHVIVRGRTDQFPYVDPKQGLFKVTAELQDGVLDYGSNWPQIEKLNVNMLFQGSRMELKSEGGNILGNQFKTVKAVIPVLDADEPVLQIVGETQGSVTDAIRFVNNSPVLELTDGLTNDLRTSGSGKLNLELSIPLENIDASKIKGSYQITNASMAGTSIPDLTRINGKLEFTESGMSAKNISANVYGGPARLDISSGQNRLVKVAARGNITDTGIRSALGDNLGNLISGNADWFSDISIQPQQVNVTIRSSLAGLALDLPQPIGKSAEEKMPLRIEKRQQSAKQDLIIISMANQISAQILRNEVNGVYQVDRGQIGINVLPEIPAQPGIEVRGSFEQLNLDQWLTVLEKSKGPDTGNNAAPALPIQRVNLAIDTLDVFERRINALKLDASKADDGWRMQIQSREMNGDVRWISKDNGKVIARLRNMTVPGKTPQISEIKERSKKLEYPDLDIVADNFIFGQKELGRLELRASEIRNDWQIDQLRISNPDSVLTANGEWHNWLSNPNTQMNVNWDINQLGNTLARFGYPDVIKDGTTQLSGKLRWPGSPHEFNVEQLSGTISLDARSGQILKIKPGVGRLFSVLTLQNLPRRLTFDFRDVLSSGFTFDKISSTAEINQGIMRSDNFLLEGPVARIDIKGETDLKKETQNLKVKVTPYISDSVSLAALAGGPAVAAAAFIAQKLLKDPLNKFAAEEYEITGTWDDPIERNIEKTPDEAVKKIPGQ
ncbi:MAG: TIGR02099 family protein [Betaproteobacteria bacterium HGW-Betaproteobacteria-1]|jgi:uncharacterized protein (TIGR02099 family)|nr:MAG: TIGR02099 family protein [Betaproteobacteria bacterium HGW-Betaproteobacteria-1]